MIFWKICAPKTHILVKLYFFILWLTLFPKRIARYMYHKGYLPICDMGNLQSGAHNILTSKAYQKILIYLSEGRVRVLDVEKVCPRTTGNHSFCVGKSTPILWPILVIPTVYRNVHRFAQQGMQNIPDSVGNLILRSLSLSYQKKAWLTRALPSLLLKWH